MKANILIDQDRHARLAGFRNATFARDPEDLTISALTTNAYGAIRWMSPELLDPEKFGFEDMRPTKGSDCYALGMVILEVLSGRVPFVGDKDVVVIRIIAEGKIPKRPEEAWFTNDVWGTLKSCWESKPQNRPRLKAVLQCLENASVSWTSSSHPVPPTANSSEGELPRREGIQIPDVSWDPSPPLEAGFRLAREPTTQSPSPGPDGTQVRSFIRPLVPILTRGPR